MTDTPASAIARLFAEAQAHHHAGRLRQAQEIYAAIVGRDERHADALHLLGTVLAQRGHLEQAIYFLRRATQLRPDRAPYFCNLGVVWMELGHYDQSKAAFERAIAADGKSVAAYYNLGNLLKQMDLPEAAVLAYAQARSLDPTHVDAHINMGNVFYDAGSLDQAAEAFEAAFEVAGPEAPRGVRALINLGNTYRRIGDSLRAVATYDRVLARGDHAGLRIKRATVTPVIVRSWEHITSIRAGLTANLRELLGVDLSVTDPFLETSSTNFFLAYHGLGDRELQELTAQVHLKSCPDLAFVAPHIGREGPNTVGAKIRVGFVSAFFRRHSVGRLMEGLIAGLPKDEYEVVVATQPGPRDAIAQRIEAAADMLVKLPDGLAPARDAIAAAQCDVLIYPEIGMDVRTYFLAFARLAPVQAVMWGHPDTTGIPNLDWFVSSELIEGAGAEAHYSEKLHRLKTLPTRYARPELPETPRARESFGFDAGKRLYLCQQSIIKHHPDLDRVIASILRGDERGEVVMLEGTVRNWADQVRERLAQNIPDVAQRVRFVPRLSPDDFIALTDAADVVFDAPHFSGGNTSYEAFALGKPVVAHAGEFMRGRVTLGQYRTMGFGDEFVSDSVDGIGALALKLGLDADYRKDAEARVRAASLALWDEDAAVAEFAAFLRFAQARAIG